MIDLDHTRIEGIRETEVIPIQQTLASALEMSLTMEANAMFQIGLQQLADKGVLNPYVLFDGVVFGTPLDVAAAMREKLGDEQWVLTKVPKMALCLRGDRDVGPGNVMRWWLWEAFEDVFAMHPERGSQRGAEVSIEAKAVKRTRKGEVV